METDLLTSTFAHLHSRLTAMARRLMPSADDADDALQEAFCRLWSRRDSITDPRQAEGVSMTTVRNICIDSLRQRNMETISTDTISDTPEEENESDITDRLEQVRLIIDTALSTRHREILYMRDLQQTPIEEIAISTGLSEANVRLILSRARRTVRECYTKNISRL